MLLMQIMETNIGGKFRAARRRLKLTQRDVARQAGEGVTQSDVSRIESGELHSSPKMGRIAKILGLPVSDILPATRGRNRPRFPDPIAEEWAVLEALRNLSQYDKGQVIGFLQVVAGRGSDATARFVRDLQALFGYSDDVQE